MAVLLRGSASLAGLRLPRALLAALAVGAPLVFASDVCAEQLANCRVINVDFTPNGIPASSTNPEINPQIVAWIEKPTGEYVTTIYITQETGRYGIGNRPGRYDFNSGPGWPYGRRTTVLPVWAHRHGVVFPMIGYRNGEDSNLSHPSAQSSRETHFCRPLHSPTQSRDDKAQWDAATCSSTVYTDKGVFQPISDVLRSYYPPRSDLIPVPGTDSSSVSDYKQMNPFDAVSQATPRLGTATQISWRVPKDLLPGNYVLLMEVSLEQDFNDKYTEAERPSPSVTYGDYGVPYRGQPSVVYQVAFEVSDDHETTAITDTYAGYGDAGPGIRDADPNRSVTGTLYPPDPTITTGAARLMMMSRDDKTFRVRVTSRPEFDHVAPGQPGDMLIADTAMSDAKLTFVAAGNDGAIGTVKGYEVRYRAGDTPITEAEFDTAAEVPFTGNVVGPGQLQDIVIHNLLPETTYTFAVRAYDGCHNTSNVTSATFTTSPRKVGQVDACFIATAAYGSVLAGDVEALRRFRDRALRKSVLGELAVEAYYTFGPTLAGVIGESELLRSTSRDLLAPIVRWVRGSR